MLAPWEILGVTASLAEPDLLVYKPHWLELTCTTSAVFEPGLCTSGSGVSSMPPSACSTSSAASSSRRRPSPQTVELVSPEPLVLPAAPGWSQLRLELRMRPSEGLRGAHS